MITEKNCANSNDGDKCEGDSMAMDEFPRNVNDSAKRVACL